jgi:CheY-like chemotaxis protein
MSGLKPILLVEDNARDIELMLTALRENRLANRVIVLRDGSEALRYLQDRVKAGFETHPAVILLDIKMPKVSGIEVLRTIKADPDLKTLPVVMLSASREGPDLTACYGLGVNAYVVKPMEFGKFFEAIKSVGQFWAVVNEQPEHKVGKEARNESNAAE